MPFSVYASLASPYGIVKMIRQSHLTLTSCSASSSTLGRSETITLSVTLSNIGNEMADPTTLRWFRSTDNIIDPNEDTPVGTNALSHLAVDASSNVSISINVPDSLGAYYYGACVDSVMGE